MTNNTYLYLIICLILGAAIVSIPVFTQDPYILSVFIMLFLNSALACSLHPILLCGQLSIAHRGFMAIGAYTSAILVTKMGLSFWITMPVAGIVTGLFALPIGWLTLRLRGIYFVCITFALNEIIRMTIIGWDSLLGSFKGIPVPVANSISLSFIPIIDFQSKVSQYYLIVVLAIITILVIYSLEKSRLGKILRGTEQNPDLAESLGIDIHKYKLIAFVTGCFFAGILGAFFCQYLGVAHPDSFTSWDSMYILLYNQVGGIAMLGGPIVGASLLTVLPELLRINREIQPLLFGSILILTMLFLPGGLLSLGNIVKDYFNKLMQANNKTTGYSDAH